MQNAKLNWDGFIKEMQRFEVAFQKQYTTEAPREFYEDLKEIGPEIFRMACAEIRKKEERLPVVSTILRYVEQEKIKRLRGFADLLAPMSAEEMEKQSEINRTGMIKIAQKILKLPDAGFGMRRWAEKIVQNSK